MCEPTTIALIASAAISAVGAGVAKTNSDNAVMAQAEAANRNTSEGYRVAQQNQRNAEAQAFEQQTDRMRQTSRQLSLARVIAAEGGGSLAANAINIAAAGDEDFSRIDASLTNQKSTVRDQMAALQTGNADALASSQIALKGNQTKFFADEAAAAGNAYSGYASQQSRVKLAQHYSETYKLKKD
jgi:hypothetical protein